MRDVHYIRQVAHRYGAWPRRTLRLLDLVDVTEERELQRVCQLVTVLQRLCPTYVLPMACPVSPGGVQKVSQDVAFIRQPDDAIDESRNLH